MWHNFKSKYPNCWNIVQVLMTAFSKSYLVEASLSHLSYLLNKQRNCLNVVERGDIRLKLSNSIKPDITKLASECQAQGSH